MKAKKIVAKATKAEFQVKFGHLGKTEMETVRSNLIQMIIDTDDKGKLGHFKRITIINPKLSIPVASKF